MSHPRGTTLARRLANLDQAANVVRVLATFWLILGLAASIISVILGFTEDETAAVLAGLGGAFVTVLAAGLLLMFANWALAWVTHANVTL